MGNRSPVMVCWTGIDDIADGGDEHISRVKAVVCSVGELVGFSERELAHLVAWPCPHPDSLGGACELVLIFHLNHAPIEEIGVALMKMQWEHPDKVQIIWKNEDMDGYQIVNASKCNPERWDA